MLFKTHFYITCVIFWLNNIHIVRGERELSKHYTATATTLDDHDTHLDMSELVTLHFESEIKIYMEETAVLYFNYSFLNCSQYADSLSKTAFELYITPEDTNIADTHGNQTSMILSDHLGNSMAILDNNTMFGGNMSFEVKGLWIGYGIFSFHIKPVKGNMTLLETSTSNKQKVDRSGYKVVETTDDFWKQIGVNETRRLKQTYRLGVMRKETIIDTLFLIIVMILVTLTTVAMGCTVDLEIVKEVLKKPIAPAIGFSAQFIIMPTLAYAICMIAGFTGNSGLGFFASGCAPGGGSSNKYTFLVGGDVSLSVTMTLISTIASLGMIPLWFFTLGQTFIAEASDTNITIPFENILMSLGGILIAISIGVFFKYKVPKVAKFLLKIIRPMIIIVILFMFSFGIWANLYIFKMFTPVLIIAGMCLPYVGFILGGLTAIIFRQPLPRIKAIAIETGIQNTGVPIMLLKFSLPAPDSDIALVAIIAASMFTPLPLWIATAFYEIKRRCFTKKVQDDVEGNDAKFPEELEDLNENLDVKTNGYISSEEEKFATSTKVHDKEMVT